MMVEMLYFEISHSFFKVQSYKKYIETKSNFIWSQYEKMMKELLVLYFIYGV